MYHYLEARILKVVLYGFMSGVSLLLSGNTINFWLASYGVNSKLIGFFSLIAFPYALKYFIAIFINHLHLKKPQYKKWLIASQVMICLSLLGLSRLTLDKQLWLVALFGFLIAFFSVMQDIILNGNRIETLGEIKQVQGTTMFSVGFRLGNLASGAGVIFASSFLSWSNVFIGLSLIYLCFIILVFLLFKEVEYSRQEDLIQDKASILSNIFVKPFKDLMPMKDMIWFLVFILVYRLADNMLMVMVNPLMLKIGYTALEIASIYKFFGTITVIIGVIVGGILVKKIGIRPSLNYIGIAHVIGGLLYIVLSVSEKNIELLYLVTIVEAGTGGMVMTAYISFISSRCKGKYTASQYALFSSVMGFSRVVFPCFSGIALEHYGVTGFFILISVISFVTTIFTAFAINKKYI